MKRRLNKKVLEEQLRDAVYQCWILLADYDFKEICNLTGLSLATLHRLYNGEYSPCVRFGTIQSLANASGLEISFSNSNVELKFTH